MNLTKLQFALLKAILQGRVGRDTGHSNLERINNQTMFSLCLREYIWIDRKYNLIVTDAGLEAFESYAESTVPLRKKPGPVSKGIQHIIRTESRHRRKVVEMRKSA